MTIVQRKATFRLYPNDVQAAALEQTHALHCRVWNALLEEHQRRYKTKEPSLGFAGMCKELTRWRGYAGALDALSAQSLQVTAKRASLAFQAFFRCVGAGQTAGFPRFKSRNRFTGWGYKCHGDGWRLLGESSALSANKAKTGYRGSRFSAVRLSGMGTSGLDEEAKKSGNPSKYGNVIPLRGRVRFTGTPVTAEVLRKGGTKNSTPRWYLSVTFNVDDVQFIKTTSTKSMSFDWGLTTLLTQVIGDWNTGTVARVDNPRWLKTKLNAIKDLQQGISLLEEKSKTKSGKQSQFPVNCALNRLYQRLRSVHSQIARQRGDFYHKLTRALVEKYAVIVTEQLSTKNMSKAPKSKPDPDKPGEFLPNGAAAKAGLNRSILDAAPAGLLAKLRTKAEEAGSKLIEIPTKTVKPSQRCCQCGHVEKHPLTKRIYTCTNTACNNVMGRDENAARTMMRYAFVGAWWKPVLPVGRPGTPACSGAV